MAKKMTMKVHFVDKPEDGKFSYRATRKALSTALLGIVKEELKAEQKTKPAPETDKTKKGERLFNEVYDFDVTKEGEGTLSLKVEIDFGKNLGSEYGTKKEDAIDSILGQVESVFGIGGTTENALDEDKVKEAKSKGILSVGFIMGLKDEEAK